VDLKENKMTMTSVVIGNTKIDRHTYETMFMSSEIMENVMSYVDSVYGSSYTDRILFGNVEFTNRVIREYWDSTLG
jgi:hypothetical protein